MLLRPYRHPRPDDNDALINSQAETLDTGHVSKPCLSLPCKTSLRDGTFAEIVFQGERTGGCRPDPLAAL
jgi:hypothetical protein